MKYTIGFFIAFLVPFALFGNGNSENPNRKLMLHGIQFQGGFLHAMNYPGSLAYLQALVPDAEIWQSQSFEGYHSWPTTTWTNSGVAGVSVLFRFAEPGSRSQSREPQFRLGIRYQGNHYDFFNANRSEAFLIDSLYNGQGEVIGHIDSVEAHFYHLFYKSDQLHVDFSMIYSTRPDLRFTLFGGIGVAGGFSTRSWLQINHYTRTYSSSHIRDYGYADHYQHYFYLNPHRTLEQAPGNAAATFYLPMGLRFRLGQHGSRLEHVQLSYELQPCIQGIFIRGFDPLVQTGVMQSIGISLQW